MRIHQAILVVAGLSVMGACVTQPAAQPAPVTKRLDVVPFDGQRLTFDTPHLDINVSHPKQQETDFVTVEVLNPKGVVFRDEKLPLGEDGAATLRLQVRGTLIEDYSMSGVWTVAARFNYASQPYLVIPFEIEAGH